MVDTAAGTYRPTWKNRRRTIFGTLFYCGGSSLYLITPWSSADPEVAKMALMVNAVMATGIIASYVFGAVFDDKNVLASLKQ